MKKGFLLRQGQALTSNPWLASGVVLLSCLLPQWGVPLAWVGFIILSLFTLQNGYRQAGLPLLAALLSVGPYIAHEQWVMMAHQLSLIVAAYGLAALFVYARSWSLLVEALAAFGVVGILLLHWIFGDVNAWWTAHFNDYFQQIPAEAQLDKQAMQQVAAVIAQFASGMQWATMMLSMLINFLLARVWWIMLQRQRESVRQECHQVRASWSMVVLAGVASVLGLIFAWPPAIDVLPILVMPFLCAGISLLHARVYPTSHRVPKLIAFYLSLIFLAPYSLFVVGLAGLLDVGLDLRHWQAKSVN